jgi:Zn-finger nucleic acid-binding protein
VRLSVGVDAEECGSCLGVWFEKGEAEQLLKLAPPSGGKPRENRQGRRKPSAAFGSDDMADDVADDVSNFVVGLPAVFASLIAGGLVAALCDYLSGGRMETMHEAAFAVLLGVFPVILLSSYIEVGFARWLRKFFGY